EHLAKAGLSPESLQTYAGPRRLTLVAEGLPPATPDQSDEIRGPRTNAPPQALEGFLRKTGLAREQLTERDGVFFATVSARGRPTPEIVAEAVPAVVRAFPWPKSMRSAAGQLRWVRPIRRIVCLFDGAVVPFSVEGVESGNVTEGHRFMGSGQPVAVRDFADYRGALEREFVVLDAAERRARILDRARRLCSAENLELIEDEGLLDEVSGLSEWPIPVLGAMDPRFLDLPPEVIRTSMRTHQKYFALRAPGSTGLAPRFLAVANIEASDGGAAMTAGYGRVLSARLGDARFFWDEDRKGAFDAWLGKLNGVTFHAKLGTVAQRVERIAALARELAPLVGADADLAQQAARLAKADLASGMVGEFPELQGVMGGYYAREWGLDPQIAHAIRDHYKPQGPNDAVPTAPVTVAVALADKLDQLVGFFAVDEKPTGSKDPYALRRAALGVIRIVVEGQLRAPLRKALLSADRARMEQPQGALGGSAAEILPDILAFFADRLKVVLRDQGRRHDLVDAVFALGDDDLVRIAARVEALSAFLNTEDGANLLAGYKRAVNILRAEGKKTGDTFQGRPDPAAFTAEEERALHAAAERAAPEVDAALDREDFAAAMTSLAALRAPVDAFFDRVLVNDPDPAVRLNRLRLLGQVRDLMNRVADFSQVAG
ncbi:MAG: glycine--tRNA ligase subunit beta, partial [Proteobacteria bacterium]|nr:glycine--tRNA ligase subunit beta [Pseudomonadota bacterium]